MFLDVADGVFDDDMMFNEDEDFEICASGQTLHSQLKTPAANGLLNFNR